MLCLPQMALEALGSHLLVIVLDSVFKASQPCGLLDPEAVMVNPGLPHQTSGGTSTIPVLSVLPLWTCGRCRGGTCELDKILPEIKPSQIIL